jgi:hypothetical protein
MGWSDIMSSVLGVTKDLMWKKFKLVNLILFFDVIVVGLILTTGILRNKLISYGEGVLVLCACVVYFSGVILLVWENEKILSSNRYRLIPLSESKLYFVNLITACLAYFYLGILATGIFIFSSYTQMKTDIFLHFVIATDMQLDTFVMDSVITILGIILIWTSSTTIHLLLEYVSDFFNFDSRRGINICLNIVILLLASTVVFLTLTQMSRIGMNRYQDVPNNSFEIVCLLDVFGIISSSVVNLILLNNFSETTR